MNQAEIQTILNKAVALHQAQKLDEAEADYAQVILHQPDNFTANHLLGVIAQQRGLYPKAIELIKKALKTAPDNVSACSNLGVALMNQGLLDEAANYLKNAIKHNPGFADAHHNLSAVKQSQGCYEEALVASLKAISLQPDNAQFNNSLANAYHELGELQLALKYYDKAIAVDAQYARAHTNRGISLLLAGQFSEGFNAYQQWRFKQPGYLPLRSSLPSCSLWQGESLDGKKILLLTEQGFGDSFQFVRYLELLKQRFECETVLACQDRLLPIFSSIKSIDVLMSKAADLPQCDYYAPLMAMPMLLREQRPYVPPANYMSADAGLLKQWKQKLSSYEGFNIGLVWKGSDEYSADHKRSFNPSVMEPLATLKGVNWFCLHMDYTEDKIQNEQSALNIHCFPGLDKNTGAFMDTAALMKNMDMVITSDTSLAHLAGALGVSTSLALCYLPDWRWQFKGGESDWYPNMRLFRQRQSGDWNQVFEDITAHINKTFLNN